MGGDREPDGDCGRACEACGAAATDPCRYCGRPVCADHRRPSRHACTGPGYAPSTPDRGADADRGTDPVRAGAALLGATLLVAAAVLLATALAPAAGPATLDETRTEQLVHELVNEERRARGLGPLDRDATLARMAADHSARMAREGSVGHGPGSLSDRYDRYGLDCHGGENVYATTVVGDYGERAVARRTVDAWLASPGHRETLLKERFTAHGVGVATVHRDGRTTVYVTQDLC